MFPIQFTPNGQTFYPFRLTVNPIQTLELSLWTNTKYYRPFLTNRAIIPDFSLRPWYWPPWSEMNLPYSWRFSRDSAPIHGLVHSQILPPNAGTIAKTMTSNGKQLTVIRKMLTPVARDQRVQLKVAWCCRWNLIAFFKICFYFVCFVCLFVCFFAI